MQSNKPIHGTPASSSSRSNVQAKSSGAVQHVLRGLDFEAQEAALTPVQRKGGGDTAGVHEAAQAGTKGGGGTLPYASQVQQAFGSHDVSGIKAHTGSDSQAACQAMGAEAYASGDNVAFGSAPDLHTVAHEAAHVVQQKAGVSLSGGVGQAGDSYEQHADQVADAVVQGKSAEPILDKMAGGGGSPVVQQKLAIHSAHAPSPSLKAKLSNSSYVKILALLKKYESKGSDAILRTLLVGVQGWIIKHGAKPGKASKAAYLKNLETAVRAELAGPAKAAAQPQPGAQQPAPQPQPQGVGKVAQPGAPLAQGGGGQADQVMHGSAGKQGVKGEALPGPAATTLEDEGMSLLAELDLEVDEDEAEDAQGGGPVVKAPGKTPDAKGADAGPQAKANAPQAPVQDEAAAMLEDQTALHDCDGKIDLFKDSGKIDGYFTNYVARHPNYGGLIAKHTTGGGKLSDLEVRSVIGYTGPAYVPLNRLNRGQMKSNYFKNAMKPYNDACRSGLGKCKGTTEIKSTRGWHTVPGNDPAFVRNIYDRDYVEEKAFVSTTVNAGQGFFAGPVSFTLFGKSGVHVKEFSLSPSEGEVLYPPMTRFKVESFVEDAAITDAWKEYWRDNNNPKPAGPAFNITLREQ